MTLTQKTDTDFEMTSLYEQAEKRVANSESLTTYRDFILPIGTRVKSTGNGFSTQATKRLSTG